MVPGVVKLGMMPSDKKGQLCLVVSDRGDVRTLCSLLFWKIKAFYVFVFQSPLILIYYQFETKKRWLMAWKIRSSHQRCSVRKGVPRNFAKFTGKHLCQSLFLIKMQTWGKATSKSHRKFYFFRRAKEIVKRTFYLLFVNGWGKSFYKAAIEVTR